MWWWDDSGWIGFWMLELVGAVWLLIVLAIFGIDRVLHGRSARAAQKKAQTTTVPAGVMDAPDTARTAA